jgi:hypothetical protein
MKYPPELEPQDVHSRLERLRKAEQDFLNRKAPGATETTPEQKEALRNYWNNVYSTEPKQKGRVVLPQIKQVLDYSDARKKFWAILQMRAAHISTIENREFDWVFSEDDAMLIKNMLAYFINDHKSPYPLSKGLFIYGISGTGKTELMTAFSKFTELYNPDKHFEMVSMSEVYIKAKSDKDYDPITPNVQGGKCFDELLRYSGAVTRFGEPIDINESIIEMRYLRKMKYGQITHFISNATPNEIKDRTTHMLFDRISKSMCASVYFKGESKRK